MTGTPLDSYRVLALLAIAILPWEWTEGLRCRFDWHDEPDMDPNHQTREYCGKCKRCGRVFEL